MNSKDILCNEIYEEFNRSLNIFKNCILGATSILKGDIFKNLKELQKLSDDDIPDDISEISNAISMVISSAVETINSTIQTKIQDINDFLEKDYNIRQTLESININPDSFNVVSNLNKNITLSISNYATYLFSQLILNDIATNISRLENSVPKKFVEDIFKMKNNIQQICLYISLPTDLELENMLSSVSLNLNSEFNPYSQIITSKFNFSFKKLDYISKLSILGRKIDEISKKLKI